MPTEKRVKRWALSMEDLVSDPTGLQEFTNYLRKQFSHENIRFWMAVNDLRRSSQQQIASKVHDIFESVFTLSMLNCLIFLSISTFFFLKKNLLFIFIVFSKSIFSLLI